MFEQVAEALSGENKKAQWWLFGILFASAAGIISQLIGPLPGIHFLASLICMSVPLGEYVYLRNQIPPEVTVFVRMQSLAPLWILVAVSLLNLGIASIQSGLYRSIRHRRRERRKFDFDPVLPPPLASAGWSERAGGTDEKDEIRALKGWCQSVIRSRK